MSPGEDFVFGGFRLDPARHQLWRGTGLLPLRPKLFAALRYLVENSGRLITREELLRAVWSRTHVDETLLRGTMRDLRALLGDDAEAPIFIETIPHQGYRFIGEVLRKRADHPDSAVPAAKRSNGVFERGPEFEQLSRCSSRALDRQRQVVFVTGEPGIGKTTLVDAFAATLPNQHGMLVGRGQCVEQHGVSEPYLPMLEAIIQLCRHRVGKRVISILDQHAPTWLVQLPSLLTDAELDSLQRKTQGAGRERMLREMAEAIEALSVEMPLAFVFEDLHWSDHSTLDLLGMLARRREPARLLILGTYRPADVIVTGHPLRALKQELHSRRLCEEIPLGFLSVHAITDYLTERFAATSDAAFGTLAETIHRRTDGNPLFMVNVADDLVGRGLVEFVGGVWRVSGEAEQAAAGVPEGLKQLIDRQLERLPAEDQRLLEAASVAGRIFSTAAVAAILDNTNDDVDDHCERLAGRSVFIEEHPDGAYAFLHDLYQRVLYDRLSKFRRARLHARAAQFEVQAHADLVRERAAQLAVHFERGGDNASAIEHLKQAATNAHHRQAFQEAIDLLRHALELLVTLPPGGARNESELALQMLLSTPLLMAKGYSAPEAAAVAARARELSQQLQQSPVLVPALIGMVRVHFTRAELDDAAALAEQSLALSQHAPDPLPVITESVMMYVSYFRGELIKARTHAERGAAIYDIARHGSIALAYGDDPGVLFAAFGAWTLWRLGYAEQARTQVAAANQLARRLEIPYCEAMALGVSSWVQLFERDLDAATASLDALETLANRHGFPLFQAHGCALRGWLLTQREKDLSTAAELIERGLAMCAQIGFQLATPSLMASLAEALAGDGHSTRARTVVDEAIAISTRRGELLDRMQALTVKGALCAASSEDDEAAACFKEAIASAQRQAAKSLYQPFYDKVEAFKKTYKQTIAAEAKPDEAAMRKAAEVQVNANMAQLNSIPMIAQMGGIEKLAKMTPEQRAQLAKQMRQQMIQNMQQIPASSPSPVPSIQVQLPEAQHETNQVLVNRDAAGTIAIQQDLQSMLQQRAALDTAFRAKDYEITNSKGNHQEINQNAVARLALIPMVNDSIMGRVHNLEQEAALNKETAELHRDRANWDLQQRTALFMDQKVRLKDLVAAYQNWFRKNQDNLRGVNTEIAVAEYEVSFIDAAYELAKYSESVTKDAANFEEMSRQGTGAIRARRSK